MCPWTCLCRHNLSRRAQVVLIADHVHSHSSFLVCLIASCLWNPLLDQRSVKLQNRDEFYLSLLLVTRMATTAGYGLIQIIVVWQVIRLFSFRT